MSNDYCDDSLPRNAPKPAPLNEVTAKPTVPEVSLLLDQDKNPSFHLNNPVKSSETKVSNSEPSEQDQNKDLEILNGTGNKFESYNTWKAKNALALHAITGSVGKKDIITLRTERSRNLKGERSRQLKNREFYQPQRPEVIVTSPGVINRIPNKMYSNQASKPVHEYDSRVNENFPQRLVYNDEQQRPITTGNLEYNRQPTSENYIHARENGTYPSERNVCQFSKEQQAQRQNPPVPMFLPASQHMVPGVHDQPIHSYGLHGAAGPSSGEILDRCNKVMPGCHLPNSCSNNPGHGDCHCSQDSHRIDQGGGDCMRSNPIFPREAYQMLNPMLVPPQNMAQMNNQTVIELYRIIHLQNEQILMLQNQVREMLKIHLDCGKQSSEQNVKCSCETVNNRESKGDNSAAKESLVKCISDQKKVSSSDGHNVSPKRSIGVMTSSIQEDSSPQNVQRNVVASNKGLKSKSKKSKKKQEIQREYMSPSCYKLKIPSYHGPSNRKERGNRRNKLSAKKTPKEEVNGRNQEVNSFTLNEAELPVGTDSEDDDSSPYNSVNMLDYCNNSDDCDDSDSGESSSDDDDDDDSGEESGTEGYSSDPQLGWTFYNQVVGQVNNLLKKKPTPPRRERGYKPRFPPNQMYMNGGHDMENNWSKRVTFDGPSSGDSENLLPSMRNVPLNQARMGQDFRPNGGPMMQDFRMYNIADGNSNLSFATLRRLDHYNLMPPSYGGVPDQSFTNNYQNRGKKGHKKSPKYKEPEKYPHATPHQKKKTKGPSSKLLDITAIKQQPKLF